MMGGRMIAKQTPWKAWRQWELDLIADGVLTNIQIARQTGRSASSIASQRYAMRHPGLVYTRRRKQSRKRAEQSQRASVHSAVRKYAPWTEREDARIHDDTLSDKDIAVELGRTFYAVRARRETLKKRAQKQAALKLAAQLSQRSKP